MAYASKLTKCALLCRGQKVTRICSHLAAAAALPQPQEPIRSGNADHCKQGAAALRAGIAASIAASAKDARAGRKRRCTTSKGVLRARLDDGGCIAALHELLSLNKSVSTNSL